MEPFYYFGDERHAGDPRSDTHAGHFLYLAGPGGRLVYADHGSRCGAWKIEDLDGRLAGAPSTVVEPATRYEDTKLQRERLACLHHGTDASGAPWTAVSLWDRSGDRRYGSSSTVLCKGTLSIAEMLDRFRERLPGLWARITRGGPIVGHPQNRDPAPRLRVEVPKLRVAVAAPAPVAATEIHTEGEVAPLPPRRAVL